MKGVLTLLFIGMGIGLSNAQIVISGFLNNPNGPLDTGYEYVQCLATQDIDFSKTPFSLITMTSSRGALGSEGWASGRGRTFKFNLVSGTVKKGAFFYVGGDKRLINGEGSTDISMANWIRTIDYSVSGGDDGIGTGGESAGIFPNAPANAGGIAVFNGTLITKSSVPIDVLFFGELSDPKTLEKIYDQKQTGYRIALNDYYNPNASEQKPQALFGQGTNTFHFPYSGKSDNSIFYKFEGDFSAGKKIWNVPRKAQHIKLKLDSSLSDIESGNTITINP